MVRKSAIALHPEQPCHHLLQAGQPLLVIGTEAMDREHVALQIQGYRARCEGDGIGEHRAGQIVREIGAVLHYYGVYRQPGTYYYLRHVVIGLDYLPYQPEHEPRQPEQNQGGYTGVQGLSQQGDGEDGHESRAYRPQDEIIKSDGSRQHDPEGEQDDAE